MKTKPISFETLIKSDDIDQILKRLRTLNDETLFLIKDAKKTLGEEKVASFKKTIVVPNARKVKTGQTVKAVLNQQAAELYNIYCTSKNFQPSEFFSDLLYLLNHLDDLSIDNPDKTISDLFRNPLLKKILG